MDRTGRHLSLLRFEVVAIEAFLFVDSEASLMSSQNVEVRLADATAFTMSAHHEFYRHQLGVITGSGRGGQTRFHAMGMNLGLDEWTRQVSGFFGSLFTIRKQNNPNKGPDLVKEQ